MSVALGPSHAPAPGGGSDGGWGPTEALCSALLATFGFVVTFLLIFVGASATAVVLAALVAVGSVVVEIHLLNRLP
ncbi:hypothetical protein [Gordonia aquimaris]|uniref:Uncharacterized protein n=1 Tax=Gordonia aquimaris TaxID=2984863 RepID=A0A9X3D1I5_9ACTN|nr:hypothetical protein [Gordonia aquimaris]MCX2963123.1 hypothetical protein [Gordonia aquimaris]